MATILIAEPHDELAHLVAIVIGRLGHEPVVWEGRPTPPSDLLVLEPADPSALAFAREQRAFRPGLPILCVSILPPSDETRSLAPADHLLKPFRLAELEAAIRSALVWKRGSGNGGPPWGAAPSPLEP
jgi:DNA-binding response OmpR family regulator